MIATLLIATWQNGLMTLADRSRSWVFEGRCVSGLTTDRSGRVLAIVDRHALCARAADGEWTTLATSQRPLSCIVEQAGRIYVGTDDACLLVLGDDAELIELDGFDSVPGREHWYAGTAIVDGREVGPPLGVRSVTATADGAALLVNVHVGGVPRSTDGGLTWEPTLDIDHDVHEVCAHPQRPEVVIAAAASGLLSSHDCGATWHLETAGLHASYCSACAVAGEVALVAASSDHFAERGALYARHLDDEGPLSRLGRGLPAWLDGIVDSHCIATRGELVAIADSGGQIYVSEDAGESWSQEASGVPQPSSLAFAD